MPDPGPAGIPGAAGGLARPLLGGAGVGVLIGLGFAVKLTMALALGLALACLLAYRSSRARSMRLSHPAGRCPAMRPERGVARPAVCWLSSPGWVRGSR